MGQLFDRVRSGVVRIETTTCHGVGSGTGFLIAPDLVATVAHVVKDARTISLRVDDGVIRGEVVGMDVDRDLALVRAIRPLPGHTFEFSERAVDEGDHITVLGYPLGLPLSVNQGQVTGLDRRLDMGTTAIEGALQHDAAATSGNSGGPLIDAAGRVVGLHEAGQTTAVRSLGTSIYQLGYVEVPGIKYAIPVTAALPLLLAWQNFPQRVAAPDCEPDWLNSVTVSSRHPDAPAIAVSLYLYFDGLNLEDFSRSWSLLTPAARAVYADYEDFAVRHFGTRFSELDVRLAERQNSLVDSADVSFISTPPPESVQPGEPACTEWMVRYTLRLDRGFWTIDEAANLRPPAPC